MTRAPRRPGCWALALRGALIAIALASASAPASVAASQQCPPVEWPQAPPVAEPAVIHVGSELGLLCLPGPRLYEVDGYREPVPLDCDEACWTRGAIAPGVYRFDDADGVALGVIVHTVSEPNAIQVALAAEPRIRSVRPIVLGATHELVPREEAGDCSALAEGVRLEREREYVVESWPQSSLLIVDAPDAASPPPAPDDLAIVNESQGGPVRQDYSRHRVVPPEGEEDAVYRWRVLLAATEAEVIPPTISHAPVFIGLDEDAPPRRDDLVMDEDYILEIQRIAQDGRASPVVRHPFTMSITDDACMHPYMAILIVFALIVLIAAVVLLGVVAGIVALVIKLRGPPRRRGS